MQTQADSPVAQLRHAINKVRASLSRSSAKQVQAKSIVNGSHELVHKYFDAYRPKLLNSGLDDESLGGLDTMIRELLVLTQKASLKRIYELRLKSIQQELNGVEVALLSANRTYRSQTDRGLDGKEERIAKTLGSLVPSAGISYEQACRDLRDDLRLSFRGAATELREALRECLDHLAPDNDVMGQAGFRLDKDQTKPTMKQKVRYILSSRGQSKSVSEAPENAVEVVEERVGALARSVYTRSSFSTHVGTTKQEVQQVKAYVDVVLSELLKIA